MKINIPSSHRILAFASYTSKETRYLIFPIASEIFRNNSLNNSTKQQSEPRHETRQAAGKIKVSQAKQKLAARNFRNNNSPVHLASRKSKKPRFAGPLTKFISKSARDTPSPKFT